MPVIRVSSSYKEGPLLWCMIIHCSIISKPYTPWGLTIRYQ